MWQGKCRRCAPRQDRRSDSEVPEGSRARERRDFRRRRPKSMKELRSFIDVCENALAGKRFHCSEK